MFSNYERFSGDILIDLCIWWLADNQWVTEASAGGGGGGGGGGHCEPLRYPQFAPVCHMLAASPTLVG